MNLWTEGPIKAFCFSLPSLPLSPPPDPSHHLVPYFFSHPLVIPLTIPWSCLLPHLFLLALLFFFFLSTTPYIHPVILPGILLKTDSALAGSVAMSDWFHSNGDFYMVSTKMYSSVKSIGTFTQEMSDTCNHCTCISPLLSCNMWIKVNAFTFKL